MSRLCVWAVVGLMALLAGCVREAVTYSGSDVTGANFGRDFHLRDADGRERSLADFRGRPVMIFFGYVQCPVVCPAALISAVEVRRALGRPEAAGG